MRIASITVVGRTHRHDDLEAGRAVRSDLQTIESAPGYADHPNIAGTPALGSQPFDDR
jgi:hypothetical protein